jgi:D-alanyl-lipoteichoic acid acyltransferase DltB (MBOAT superfamily)
MSYVIEVYKKRYKPEKNLLKYGLFVMFFPQLVAGPIERPQQLLRQFSKKNMFDYVLARDGIRLMLWGFLKKVAVADRIAVFVNPIFAHPSSYGGVSFMIAAILFAFQIYYDFSGYTDIARGAAAVLGYKLEINFNNPYLANSVQDFWRRWHITLSTWFRDYIYIPLGGSRGSLFTTSRNLLITFFLCGLWHGAAWHYVLWGVLNGLYLTLNHILSRAERFKKISVFRFFSVPSTFIIICLGWILFRVVDMQDAFYIFRSILFTVLHPFNTNKVIDSVFLQQSKFEFLIVITLIIFVEVIQTNKLQMLKRFNAQPVVIRWLSYSLLLWVIILAGRFGETAFIYYAF